MAPFLIQADEMPSLHAAINAKNTQAALAIIEQNPELIPLTTPPLKLIDSHLGEDADDDYDWVAGYEEGLSSLELASMVNDQIIVEKLLSYGMDPWKFRTEYFGSIQDSWQMRIGIKKTTTVYEKCKFINNYYRLNNKHLQMFTPMYWAIVNNNLELVKLFMVYGSPTQVVYKRNEAKWKRPNMVFEEECFNPLQLAEKLGNSEIVKYLKS